MRYCLMAVMSLLVLAGGGGCRQAPEIDDAAVLMTVGRREVLQDDFRRAYRVFRAAYGAEADEAPAAEKASILRFIQQLADQMVLMEYAREVGIEVPDGDLNQAVDEIRRDYPEGLFDQMLLETAVNFEDWKEALRVRLTIERLVQQELAANVRITEEDIAAYYAAQAPQQPVPPSRTDGERGEEVDQLLVEQLRRQKTEEAYGPWIDNIKTRYPVKIDQAVVQRILAERDITENNHAEAR